MRGPFADAAEFARLHARSNLAGRLRDIDVQTLRKVGEMIRRKAPQPAATRPEAKP